MKALKVELQKHDLKITGRKTEFQERLLEKVEGFHVEEIKRSAASAVASSEAARIACQASDSATKCIQIKHTEAAGAARTAAFAAVSATASAVSTDEVCTALMWRKTMEIILPLLKASIATTDSADLQRPQSCKRNLLTVLPKGNNIAALVKDWDGAFSSPTNPKYDQLWDDIIILLHTNYTNAKKVLIKHTRKPPRSVSSKN